MWCFVGCGCLIPRLSKKKKSILGVEVVVWFWWRVFRCKFEFSYPQIKRQFTDFLEKTNKNKSRCMISVFIITIITSDAPARWTTAAAAPQPCDHMQVSVFSLQRLKSVDCLLKLKYDNVHICFVSGLFSSFLSVFQRSHLDFPDPPNCQVQINSPVNKIRLQRSD